MQCYNCKHDFCWMCLGDWKSHGSEYYECSRYKENPNIAHESVHAQVKFCIVYHCPVNVDCLLIRIYTISYLIYLLNLLLKVNFVVG